MKPATEGTTVVTYQFEIDDDEWETWKDTVPRSKALDERLRELIAADADGRVLEPSGGERGPSPTPAEAVTGPDPRPSTLPSDIEHRVRDALAGEDDQLDRRVEEIAKMYSRLRDLGTAEKSDLLDAVDVDAAGYKDRESVWANMVKGKDTLRVLPGVEPPPTGRSEWRYEPPA